MNDPQNNNKLISINIYDDGEEMTYLFFFISFAVEYEFKSD